MVLKRFVVVMRKDDPLLEVFVDDFYSLRLLNRLI